MSAARSRSRVSAPAGVAFAAGCWRVQPLPTSGRTLPPPGFSRPPLCEVPSWAAFQGPVPPAALGGHLRTASRDHTAASRRGAQPPRTPAPVSSPETTSPQAAPGQAPGTDRVPPGLREGGHLWGPGLALTWRRPLAGTLGGGLVARPSVPMSTRQPSCPHGLRVVDVFSVAENGAKLSLSGKK